MATLTYVYADQTAVLGPFVLEEQLTGAECSLLALCDGTTAVALPLSQDHKRIGEGDTGPNTGGMGAYAPAPIAADPDELLATFVQPIVDYYKSVGTPYVGVLFAGLMLTADGPRLIEYNCRFGDPETQAILPRIDSDLLEALWSCADGTLSGYRLEAAPDACVTVVAASGGYPGGYETGREISGIEEANARDDVVVFHAGTAARDGQVVTAGGRVLAVSALGADVADARRRALEAVELFRSLVTVTFNVVPVPFTDRYEIVVEQTFETHVPIPVLVVDPPWQQFYNVEPGFEVISWQGLCTPAGVPRAILERIRFRKEGSGGEGR